MQTYLLYIEINRYIKRSKYISVICKNMFFLSDKNKLNQRKEVATFKSCRLPFKISDENNIAKLVMNMQGINQ